MNVHHAAVRAALPNHKILTPIVNWNDRPTLLCRVHKVQWSARVDSLKLGSIGCPACKAKSAAIRYNKRVSSLTHIEFVERQRDKNTRDVNYHNKALSGRPVKLLQLLPKHRGLFLCKDCSHQWESRLDSVKGGEGSCCPRCRPLKQSAAKRKPIGTRAIDDPNYRNTWSDIAHLTNLVYARYSEIINPRNLARGLYHVDHIFSIRDYYYNSTGLQRPVTRLELCHPANLQMLQARENIKKNKSSWITATELRKRIRAWNKLHGRPFRKVNGVWQLSV